MTCAHQLQLDYIHVWMGAYASVVLSGEVVGGGGFWTMAGVPVVGRTLSPSCAR